MQEQITPEPVLRISHNAGFFSCCTIRLLQIIDYFNRFRTLPPKVDSSSQFLLYKQDEHEDLTPEFFQDRQAPPLPFSDPIHLSLSGQEEQFSDYRLLDHAAVAPFVDTYFSLTQEVRREMRAIETRYRLEYSKLCGVYLRGNDKERETLSPDYQDVIEQARQLRERHPEVVFLVQTDEQEFQDAFLAAFSAIVIRELRPIPRDRDSNALDVLPVDSRKAAAVTFLAIVKLLAKARYLITTSGNCALWMCLFRGHTDGVRQFLRRRPTIYGVTNPHHDPRQTEFWLGDW